MTVVLENEHGILEGPEPYSTTPGLRDILAVADSSLGPAERDMLGRAYAFAEKAHEGQKRASGAPYFSHVAQVAMELARVGLDGITISAGLLHDTVEDTHPLASTLAQEFSPEVAQLVEGVTKISARMAPSGSELHAENLRK